MLYAGAHDMAGGQVGEAGPGSANISLSRGQGNISGPAAIDFATGVDQSLLIRSTTGWRQLAFRNWLCQGRGRSTFLRSRFTNSAHVVGFGTAPSFDNLITANQFQGVTVIGLTGSAVALTADNNHWAEGTTSPPYANQPPPALTAGAPLGRAMRSLRSTTLLADTGWQVPNKLLGLPGDIDESGIVDGRDFLKWQRGFGATGINMPGDADGNHVVDEFDLWLWRQNHGQRVATTSLTARCSAGA